MNQMPATRYEVQTYDCQIINPDFPTPTTSTRPSRTNAPAKNMSLLLIVSGYVRYGEERDSPDSPNRGFSETFVLIPNSQMDGNMAGPRGKSRKQWLIQSQNFRLVV